LGGSTESSSELVAVFLKIFRDRFRHVEGPREAVAMLMGEVLVAAGRDCEASLRRSIEKVDSEELHLQEVEKRDSMRIGGILLLVHMFEQFREGLFDDVEFSRVSFLNYFLLNDNDTINVANGRDCSGTFSPSPDYLSGTSPRLPFS
jgi:hypothetical protein